jgi:flagellar motor switch protein FliM
MSVGLSARLATVELTVRDILNFQAGDVVALDCDPDQSLEILVEDKPKFYGTTGLLKGRKAVRLSRPTQHGVEHGRNQH